MFFLHQSQNTPGFQAEILSHEQNAKQMNDVITGVEWSTVIERMREDLHDWQKLQQYIGRVTLKDIIVGVEWRTVTDVISKALQGFRVIVCIEGAPGTGKLRSV